MVRPPGARIDRARPAPARLPGGRDASVFDTLSALVLATLASLVLLTFRDYGISTDEYVQQTYGEKLWAFYLSGLADRSAFQFDNLYLYGGLFDMLVVPLQAISPFDTYETRHLLCGLLGVLGIAGAWQLARELAGARAGFLAAALLALSASWYGAMFNNTKDIPFAVGMTWLLLFTVRMASALPRPRVADVVGFSAALGLSLGMRVGAVFGLLYLLTAVASQLAWRWRSEGADAAAGDALAVARFLLPAVLGAYALMAVFWPWSVLSPLNPLTAILELTQFPFRTELADEFYRATDLPPSYLPTYLAVKLPETTVLGVLLAVGFGVAAGVRRRPAGLRASGAAASPLPWRRWLPLLLAVAVPLLYFVVARPALYNGMRHFFFVVPPICVLAAAGLDRLWRAAERRGRPAAHGFAALLLLLAGREAAAMVELHPHEYVYFNALVGGPGGAFRRYELDYWSNFVPEAIELLELQLRMEASGRTPSRRYTVGLCTREEVFGEYAPPYLVATKDWQRADFIVTTTNTDCDRFAGGRTIIEVERDGAVLGVVKDRRPGTTAKGLERQPPIR